ncbi:MAG: Arm DNA-binding domain-containing protein, partial [Bacteroidota bacterium]|nr:Arm DNA-binding domain-containing protein [Bacteroidota bacterium]
MGSQASIKFYLFEGGKPNGVLPIYMRITYARKKAELHTGFTCTKKEWNQANQNTRTSTTVNKKLSDKKAAVYSFLEDLEKENKPISAAILKDLLTGKTRVKTRILEYLEN